jgi:hypothetical protein
MIFQVYLLEASIFAQVLTHAIFLNHPGINLAEAFFIHIRESHYILSSIIYRICLTTLFADLQYFSTQTISFSDFLPAGGPLAVKL